MLCEICKKKQGEHIISLVSFKIHQQGMVCSDCFFESCEIGITLCGEKQEEEKENGTLTNPEKTQ